MKDHFDKLGHDSSLTGFRPGKAPRRLIEKRFFKEVAQQVKGEVLLASLEQLGEDHEVAPLSPPQIDPAKIELPVDGPLVYEFEVEVRPEFDLPEYKGLSLKRPVKTFTPDDVAETRRRLLADQGQIVPKENGTVAIGDLVVVDMHVKDGDKEVGKLDETTLRVERQLAFKDGIPKPPRADSAASCSTPRSPSRT
jgi:trigger factor